MKVPCGGFDLDESVFNVDKNSKQIKLNSPISYDYMPEGYPSKGVGNVTLMEEQEVTFADMGGGVFFATAPVQFDVLDGQTFTIVWDGVEYSCVGHATKDGNYMGNPEWLGLESTSEPFLYTGDETYLWVSYDTSTSHTIKVIGSQETYTPIDANFIPNTIQRVGDDVIISSSTAGSTKKFKITVDDSGTLKATEI